MNAQEYKKIINNYIELMSKGDWQGVSELFCVDAIVEDPVGSEPVRGIDAVKDFYRRNTCRPMVLALDGPIRVAGIEAAFPFTATLEWEGRKTVISVIDIFRFDSAGKIESMRAFVGPDNFVAAA